MVFTASAMCRTLHSSLANADCTAKKLVKKADKIIGNPWLPRFSTFIAISLLLPRCCNEDSSQEGENCPENCFEIVSNHYWQLCRALQALVKPAANVCIPPSFKRIRPTASKAALASDQFFGFDRSGFFRLRRPENKVRIRQRFSGIF